MHDVPITINYYSVKYLNHEMCDVVQQYYFSKKKIDTKELIKLINCNNR